MFVKDNSLASAKGYFQYQLINKFTDTELKSMWKQIICKRFNWNDSDFILNQNCKLSESDLLFVRSFVKRLLVDEPFQYILGETFFYNLKINCDSRALIPRPETEELVDWISELSDINKIMDVCSGSGCISLALKSVFKNANVKGIDISPEAIELSKLNASENKLDVEFNLADALNKNDLFWDSISELDVIVANPPYITENEKQEMSANVLNFEPHLALFVESDSPIIFYQRIADLAINKLKKNGYLFFELNPLFATQICDYLSSIGFINIELRKDLQGKERMLKAQKV
jgi:release factor glutamine methyltransferase